MLRPLARHLEHLELPVFTAYEDQVGRLVVVDRLYLISEVCWHFEEPALRLEQLSDPDLAFIRGLEYGSRLIAFLDSCEPLKGGHLDALRIRQLVIVLYGRHKFDLLRLVLAYLKAYQIATAVESQQAVRLGLHLDLSHRELIADRMKHYRLNLRDVHDHDHWLQHGHVDAVQLLMQFHELGNQIRDLQRVDALLRLHVYYVESPIPT